MSGIRRLLHPGLFARGCTWRWLYVVGAVAALYLNVFVLIVQSFGKVPALKDLPPSSPAFVQLTVLTLFMIGGVLAVRRFRGLSLQPS